MSAARLVQRDENTFSLEGDIAIDSVPALWRDSEQLWRSGPAPVVDMSNVRRIDSSSVALLLGWTREARARNIVLKYRNVPRQVVSIAVLGGVLPLLPLEAAPAN